jgi:hypothetical protein
MSESPLMKAALEAVGRGWYVFALKERSKEPDSEYSPHGFNSSTNDPNEVRRIWTEKPNANYGIDLGRSNLTVLDFDHGRPPADLALPATLQVATSRGTHVYYSGTVKQSKLHLDGAKVGDIKSGGGYVLGTSCSHPDGPVYAVVVDAAIAPVPASSIDALRPPHEPIDINVNGPKIPRGQHDDTLTKMARKMRGLGWEHDAIFNALVEIVEKRCENYGSDYLEMCEKHAKRVCEKFEPNEDGSLLLNQQYSTPPVDASDWRSKFKSVGELEEGEPRMLIRNFLPEGTIFIGGLAGEGKTLLGLSIAKALTTGKNFLNQFDFSVPQITPVLYLIPESGGRAFRKRCETFQIPNDSKLFLTRTISEGGTLLLNNPWVLEAVMQMKPVVILDTLIRFSEADDENQASQNKQMVDDIIRLRQAGAVAVIGMHHATKAMREKGMSLETALRGTGDIAASADAVYGMLRDSKMYADGSGPNEIDVACLKPRDFEPPKPFRIAASEKLDDGMGVPLVISVIDQLHDFRVVSQHAKAANLDDRIKDMVSKDPNVSRRVLTDETGASDWEIRQALKRLGLTRGRGDKASTAWRSSNAA